MFKDKKIKNIHIVGIGGTLMGAFAVWLKSQGIHVTGSDQALYPPMSDVLKNAKIFPNLGYEAHHVPKDVDLCIIGNVISAQNLEAQAVMQSHTYYSLPEFMEKFLLTQSRNLVVSGTHGKTTTSSLLAYVLKESGLDPSYFIGGVSLEFSSSFYVSSQNKYFVLEGDEYDTAFWDKVPKFTHYLPNDILMTSLEFDHADIYNSLEEIIKQFEKLASIRRTPGRYILCTDYPELQKIKESLEKKQKTDLFSYGKSEKADYCLKETVFENEWNVCRFLNPQKQKKEFRIRLSGEYNALNALAVWIEATHLGVSEEQIQKHFMNFRGVKRRQEVVLEHRGITVIDDFAHHPAAVSETLKGLKMKYHSRKIIVVFEPRSATSRRDVFQKQYAESFDMADQVWICNPFDQGKIQETHRFSSQKLVADLRDKKIDAFLMNDNASTITSLMNIVKPGDVIAVLSNGGFNGFLPQLVNTLSHSS